MKGKVAVVGTGPAGLMAALVAARGGREVILLEKRKGAGRKLLVAGSSGLNITYDAPPEEFAAHYGASRERMKRIFGRFSPEDWLGFVESLGVKTFKGTSRRYFVEGMKASILLSRWQEELRRLGVEFRFQLEWTGFEALQDGRVRLEFGGDAESLEVDSACLALGGGSWEPEEKPLRWPQAFVRKGIRFEPFRASNVGFRVEWPEAFLKEAEGAPIKNVVLGSSRGKRSGDLVVTSYGLEGTPVYFAGETGTVWLDLKPDLSVEKIREKMQAVRENLSPLRRLKRVLNLAPAAQALVFHLAPKTALSSIENLAVLLKRFPITLEGPQPLDEAISSAGGVSWDELDDSLMLKKVPGIFLAGEMIDWDAPTGGFLIQACVSQGYVAGEGLLRPRVGGAGAKIRSGSGPRG